MTNFDFQRINDFEEDQKYVFFLTIKQIRGNAFTNTIQLKCSTKEREQK